jgi:hypothetical protein
MFPVWTAVIVSNPEHEYAGQAGVVHAVNADKHPNEVIVRFDKDSTCAEVATADLKAL